MYKIPQILILNWIFGLFIISGTMFKMEYYWNSIAICVNIIFRCRYKLDKVFKLQFSLGQGRWKRLSNHHYSRLLRPLSPSNNNHFCEREKSITIAKCKPWCCHIRCLECWSGRFSIWSFLLNKITVVWSGIEIWILETI